MISRRSGVLAIAAVGLCAASLGLRLWKQGPYVPGWAFVGPARAAEMLVARPPGGLATLYPLHWTEPWDVFGLMTVLPAWLALRCPWPYWFVALSLTGSAAAVAIAAAAVRAPLWIAVMAWTASGALQSWSLLGYASDTWAHAVALCLTWRVRRWWATLALAPLVALLAWGVQDLGRTVPAVFLVAALLIPRPRAARAVNVALGALLGWAAYSVRTAGTGYWFSLLADGSWKAGVPRQVDSLGFLALMPLSALLLRRRPFFWLLALGQLVLFGALAVLDPDFANPRRFTLCAFYGVVLVAAAWEAAPRARTLLTTVAILAAVAQVAATLVWAGQPLPRKGGYGYVLPFTDGQPWNMVPFTTVDAYRAIRADLDAGQAVVLLYNGDSYGENCTNPTGLLSRLYLGLGPARFLHDVIAFGTSSGCIADSLPMHPIDSAPDVLASLAGRPLVGYVVHNREDSPSFAATMATLRETLEARYTLAWDPPAGDPEGTLFQRFTLK